VNGRAELEKLFKSEKFAPLWVPYVGVGYLLAKKIERLTCDYKNRYGRGPSVIFLQNHGLVVTANDSNTALHHVRKTVGICSRKLKKSRPVGTYFANAEAIALAASAIRRSLFEATGKNMTVRHFIDESIMRFMAEKDAAKLCSLPAVTPDELVYADGPPLWLDGPDPRKILGKLNRRLVAGRQLPFVFLIRPLGLFISGKGKRLSLVKDIVSTYLSVRSLAAKIGGIYPLTGRQRKFIIMLYSRKC
jgi:rhamnose utilization protein RhaD (predicted bifunctional aldolase and dehydrogenase)